MLYIIVVFVNDSVSVTVAGNTAVTQLRKGSVSVSDFQIFDLCVIDKILLFVVSFLSENHRDVPFVGDARLICN